MADLEMQPITDDTSDGDTNTVFNYPNGSNNKSKLPLADARFYGKLFFLVS